MNKYIVLLPEVLPSSGGANRSLSIAYSHLPKRGATEASSDKKAVTNLIFRSCRDKNRARMISSYLLDNINRCEIYEVPEILDEDGSIVPYGRVRTISQEVFLADSIAKRRGIDEFDALKEARNMLETLVKR